MVATTKTNAAIPIRYTPDDVFEAYEQGRVLDRTVRCNRNDRIQVVRGPGDRAGWETRIRDGKLQLVSWSPQFGDYVYSEKEVA